MSDTIENSVSFGGPKLTGPGVKEIGIIAGSEEYPLPRSTSDVCPDGYRTVQVIHHISSTVVRQALHT